MRLIDADALMSCIPSEEILSKTAVANAPTIVVAEQKTGRWEKVLCDHVYLGLRPWTVCCSECGMIGGGTRYCPFCGADMKGENDETD